ncbi:hypothetical protein ACVWZ3_010588 [Bradyrhizobium sp. i1.3.6]
MQRTGADQYRDLLARVEHLRRAIEIDVAGHDAGRTVADTGMQRAVRAGWFLVGLLLEVVGQDDCGGGPACERDAHRAIDQVPHLSG